MRSRSASGLDGSCLADDADLDASGVCEFLFDATCDIAADDGSFFIIDDAGLDEDADFTSGLNGIAFFDAGEGEGNFLDIFEPFDIGFEDFAASARAGARERVCGHREVSVDAFGLDFGVMCGNGIADERRFAVFFEEIGTDICLRAFEFVIHSLSDIVEESDASCEFDIESEFGSHDAAEPSGFDGVPPDILAVACPVFEASDHHDDFRVDVLDAEFEEGLVASLADAFVNLLLDFRDGFFDASRMDASIGDEAFECLSSDFAADGIERGNDDSFGCIVDDEVNARCGFDASDIAAFTTDDASFDFVRRQADGAHATFDDIIAGKSLHGDAEYHLGAFFSFGSGIFFDLACDFGGFELCIVRDGLDEHCLCVV